MGTKIVVVYIISKKKIFVGKYIELGPGHHVRVIAVALAVARAKKYNI